MQLFSYKCLLVNKERLFSNKRALSGIKLALSENKNGVLKNTFGVILFSFEVFEKGTIKIKKIAKDLDNQKKLRTFAPSKCELIYITLNN